jgi:hypothetical protein
MTASHELTRGCGIYIVDDRHVARARWWLAAHPRTRDRAAIAAGLRRELRGLRHQDVPELMDEVLDGLGAWGDPAGWPAEWPEPWGRGEAHAPVAVEAPEAPAAAAEPEPEPMVTMSPTPRPPAVPRRRAPPRTPRPSRATVTDRALPGAAEAVPEAIAGVPRWDGHPVRASRIPRHLVPEPLRAIAAGARWLLWRCAQPRVSGQPVTMERVMEEAGVTRKTVQDWLAALRGAGLMLTAHEAPDRAPRTRDPRPWASLRGPRPVDYSRLVTDAGRAVVAQLPAVVAPVVGRAREDEADMGVLAVLLRRERQAAAVGLPAQGMRTSELRQLVDDAPRACARLEASGAIVAEWEARGRRIRLAAEVARAWGVGCS